MLARRTIAVVLSLMLLSCGSAEEGTEQAFTFTQFAMDTVVEYTIVASSRTEAREAMLAAHAEVERVAALLWEEETGSDIYHLNRATGPLELHAETYDFLLRNRDYSRVTGGAFDITIRPLLELYDFTDEAAALPRSRAITARLQDVGIERLRFDPPNTVTGERGVRIAVGGVAKGYAVDRAVEVLRSMGVANALVNAGGDLYAMGMRNGRPWRVGIRHPDDPSEIVDVLEVSDAGVATSGDYQRYVMRGGVRYHHILDPASGRPARHVRSATVVARTAEEADALATGLFVAGPTKGFSFLMEVPEARGIVIGMDGAVLRGSPSIRMTTW
jgi:FAD:protein FMN transferase